MLPLSPVLCDSEAHLKVMAAAWSTAFTRLLPIKCLSHAMVGKVLMTIWHEFHLICENEPLENSGSGDLSTLSTGTATHKICASGVPAGKWGILPDPSMKFNTYLINF